LFGKTAFKQATYTGLLGNSFLFFWGTRKSNMLWRITTYYEPIFLKPLTWVVGKSGLIYLLTKWNKQRL